MYCRRALISCECREQSEEGSQVGDLPVDAEMEERREEEVDGMVAEAEQASCRWRGPWYKAYRRRRCLLSLAWM